MATGKLKTESYHRIIGWKRPLRIIKSNHPPSTTMPTKLYPKVPHVHVY